MARRRSEETALTTPERFNRSRKHSNFRNGHQCRPAGENGAPNTANAMPGITWINGNNSLVSPEAAT
jgi:hypothetical protein